MFRILQILQKGLAVNVFTPLEINFQHFFSTAVIVFSPIGYCISKYFLLKIEESAKFNKSDLMVMLLEQD